MKKALCLILAMSFAIFAAGCGVEFEDTNGPDDYSLAQITDEKSSIRMWVLQTISSLLLKRNLTT